VHKEIGNNNNGTVPLISLIFRGSLPNLFSFTWEVAAIGVWSMIHEVVVGIDGMGFGFGFDGVWNGFGRRLVHKEYAVGRWLAAGPA
jgi:hypothetical protein